MNECQFPVDQGLIKLGFTMKTKYAVLLVRELIIIEKYNF